MTIKLKGSTDGSISLQAPADTSPTGTDITLTLPTDAGSADQFLKNSGTAGTLDYSSMVEDSSGNVGIGTSSPTALLHVAATSSPQLKIEDNDNGFDPVVISATNGGRDFTFTTNQDYYFNQGASTTFMTIQNGGNIGIGTTSPDNLLDVQGSSNPQLKVSATNTGSNSAGLYIENQGQRNWQIWADRATDTFRIGNNSRADTDITLTSGGHLLVGKTTSDVVGAGCEFRSDGFGSFCRDGLDVFLLNRKTNDGRIVSIRQNDTQEGSINVSGTTVSYNGGHLSRWSQLAGGAERTEILRGSVLSNLDEMCEWAYEAQDAVLYTEDDELPEGVSVGDVKTPAVAAGTEDNEQLNRMKVSDVEGDVNVSGVFVAWDDDDDTYTNDFYCAMTGDFVIRIAQGTTVARGDLLMSAGDGTAKPQDDDIVRSKTIAKVSSTVVSETYADGSYCVPCVLMAC